MSKPKRAILVQVFIAIICFASPFALLPTGEQGERDQLWCRIEFARDTVTHLTVGGARTNIIRYAAVLGRGILRNTDDPFFWAAKSEGLPSDALGRILTRDMVTSQQDPRLAYVAIDNRQQGGVYVTRNGGATWELADRMLLGPAYALAMSHDDDQLYALVGERLYHLRGNGPWRAIANVSGSATTQMALDPQDDQRLFLATDTGLRYTLDGGQTWRMVEPSLLTPDGLQALAIVHRPQGNESIAYLGTQLGLLCITIDSAGAHAPTMLWEGPDILAITAHPQHPHALYVGLRHNGVYHRPGTNTAWEPLNRGLGDTSVHALIFEPDERTYLYAGTSDGIWRCEPPEVSAPPGRPTDTATGIPTHTSMPSQTPSSTARPATSTPTSSVAPPTHTPQPLATHTPASLPTDTIPPTPSATGTATEAPVTATSLDTVTPTITDTTTPTRPPHTATLTAMPPTATPLPPAAAPATPFRPTATAVPPTATPFRPTATTAPPTATDMPPTPTSIPPTATLPER